LETQVVVNDGHYGPSRFAPRRRDINGGQAWRVPLPQFLIAQAEDRVVIQEDWSETREARDLPIRFQIVWRAHT
jgi:hypothetical protein